MLFQVLVLANPVSWATSANLRANRDTTVETVRMFANVTGRIQHRVIRKPVNVNARMAGMVNIENTIRYGLWLKLLLIIELDDIIQLINNITKLRVLGMFRF